MLCISILIYIYDIYLYIFPIAHKIPCTLKRLCPPLLLLLYPGNIGMPASLKTLEMEVTTLNLRKKKDGCRFRRSCGSGGNG